MAASAPTRLGSSVCQVKDHITLAHIGSASNDVLSADGEHVDPIAIVIAAPSVPDDSAALEVPVALAVSAAALAVPAVLGVLAAALAVPV